MQREQLNTADTAVVYEGIQLRIEWETQPEEKGCGEFISTHEILGALTEEVQELTEEVRKNDREEVMEELYDIATVAVWGILSLIKQEEREKRDAISTY